MATASTRTAKAVSAPEVPSPSPKAEDAPTARATASAVPFQDPGPPPRYPAPTREAMVGNADLARQLFDAGRRARPASVLLDDVRAIDVMRQPPGVQQYKAEVLHWIEAREAYRLAHET